MKIAVVTGTRAEYGIWIPVLQAIARTRNLHLQLVVTGMHLLPQFGHTLDQIKRDGFTPAAVVEMYRDGDTPATALARGIAGMAGALAKLKPDLVLVLGDRLEIMAGAQAALCAQIPLGHVHGGETAPGQFDEQIRHAVTKLAHVHFAATPLAAARICQMGENPAHVHVVGAPALDRALAAVRHFPAATHRASGNPLLVLHPMSPSIPQAARQAGTIISALRRAYPAAVINAIGPNNDPGHEGVLQRYAREKPAGFHLCMSLDQVAYWRMLWECPFLIGNSSSGIIEAASFGIPVINIGDRQAGRERSGNVIDVPCSPDAIRRAIQQATAGAFVRKVDRMKNCYGAGHASTRMVHVLQHLKVAELSPKRFHDLPQFPQECRSR